MNEDQTIPVSPREDGAPGPPETRREVTTEAHVDPGVLQRLSQGLDHEASLVTVSARGPTREEAPGEATVRLPVSGRGGPGAPPPPSASSAARYTVTGELGRGGMGIILSGRDTAIRREVAIKVQHRDAGWRPEAQARFFEEAQVQGQLEHPNICPVHELGVDAAGSAYFTMKMVRGRSLAEILDDPQGMTRGKLLRAFLGVCDAVAFAHSRGVIHRDLKPANVMIGEYGETLVMDWGLAKIVGQGGDASAVQTLRSECATFHSMAGTVVGTPAYMPPEQARGEVDAVGPHSDIYALGAMLYEILSGHPPYRGTTAMEIVEQVRVAAPPPPSSLAARDSIPRELEAAVLKAMARDPGDRYSSVLAFQSDIQAWIDGRVLEAADYSLLQIGLKWVRRHRAICISALAVLLTAAGLALFFHQRSEREKARELRAREERALREVADLQRRWELAEKRLAPIASPAMTDFLEPNGELRQDVIDPWYRAHEDALQTLERLAAWDRQAPTSRVRRAIARDAVDRERRAICLRAAELASQLGNESFARAWIARARAAGLTATEQAAARARIEEAQRQRLEADLTVARELLERARDPRRQGADFIDEAATDLARRRSADLVRLLLAPEHVASGHEWERRLAIEVLGRLGDTRTERSPGEDAVSVLIERLRACDLEQHFEEGVAIARALGLLADSRAHEALHEKRWNAGVASLFWNRTTNAYRRIPLPPELSENAADQPRTADAFVNRGLHRYGAGDLAGALADYTAALELDPDHEDALVNRGIVHLVSGDPESSIQDHSRAIAAHPRAPGAFYNRGNAHVTAEHYREAIADFDACLAIDPTYVPAYNGRAIARRTMRDYPAAIADYTKVIALQPDDAQAFNNRGIAHWESGMEEAALADYAEAIRLNPGRTKAWFNRSALYSKVGRLDEALSDIDRAIRNDPSNAQLYLHRSRVCVLKGWSQRALEDLTQAEHLAPDDPYHPYEIARLHRREGSPALALEALERCLEIDPAYSFAWNEVGQIHYAAGDVEACLDAFTRGIAAHPGWALGYFNRGQVLREDGHPDEAIDDFTAAVTHDPAATDAWTALISLLLDEARGADALAILTRAIEKEGKLAVLWGLRADVHRHLGQPTQAYADFTEALKRNSKSELALWGRARTAADLGRYQDGLADVATALQLNPASPRCWRLKGRLLLAAGDAPAALDALARVTLDDAQTSHLRGRCHLASHNPDDAVTALTEAARLDPEDPAILLDLLRALSRRSSTQDGDDAQADRTRALNVLRRLLRFADFDPANLLDDPHLEALRHDARFIELLDR